MAGRSLEQFGALGPAEVTLIDGIGIGFFDRPGSGSLPEADDVAIEADSAQIEGDATLRRARVMDTVSRVRTRI